MKIEIQTINNTTTATAILNNELTTAPLIRIQATGSTEAAARKALGTKIRGLISDLTQINQKLSK